MGNKLKMYVDIMACHPEVTGSCFLCVVKLPDRETLKFVVDCGLFQEDKYNQYNETLPFDCNDISFVLITHNHVDHTGRLPMLVRNGFDGNFYSTKQTKVLLPFALYDSYKVLSEIAKRKHKKNLYSESDVGQTVEKVVGLDYNVKTEISPNIYVTFLPNAHLIGAAMILVEVTYPGEEPINILFTGDYNNKNEFIELPKIPKKIRDKRLSVIIESTYGNMSINEINYSYFKEKLLSSIKDEKTVVLPVFSLGRAQEILYELKKLKDSEQLSDEIPIYLDGKLAHAYTRLYLNCEGLIKKDMVDFLPDNLTFVDCNIRETLLNCDNPKIIVTTSGMGTYGPAQVYIPYFISEKKALILFTGYTAEGTLGSELKETIDGDLVKIGGMIKRKRAEVSYCNQFSAHAKKEQLIELLKSFTNLRAVIINHGEEKTKEAFAKEVFSELDVSHVGIINRDYLFRLGSFGVEKTLTTKFK